MGIQRSEILRRFADIDAATTRDTQGKAFEDLIAYLFDAIPGCYTEKNLINPLGAEQIDVAVGNDAVEGGLPAFPAVMLVECKDWSRPVTSAVLSHFMHVLEVRNVQLGILVAANGITGDALNQTAAHSLGIAASARGTIVLIITRQDLLELTSEDELIWLVKRRRLRAVASGGLGVPTLSTCGNTYIPANRLEDLKSEDGTCQELVFKFLGGSDRLSSSEFGNFVVDQGVRKPWRD